MNKSVQLPELDPAQCYRALAARDNRYDGEFFVGVETTGIYCRPVCRAKTPQAKYCHFYQNASTAEAAGYRPCLLCRPELAPYAIQQNLAYAVWQRITAGGLNNGATMQDLAAEVGLSARQLQRLMQAHFGVSPVELAQTTRLLFAKKLLQETAMSMTELAYAAGFGSVRRFNALFQTRYGLAPGSLRRNIAPHSDLISLRLAYRAPLAWEELLDYLAGRALAGLEMVGSDATGRFYARTLRWQHGSTVLEGWLRVRQLSAHHQLSVDLGSQFGPVLMPVLDRLRRQFDLDANPLVIGQTLAQDPLLLAQMQRTPGLRVPGSFCPYELAIRAVLGQQISVAGATTLGNRLIQQFGTPCSAAPAGISHHFPTPAELAAVDLPQLAGIGLPRARAAALIAVAQFAVEGGFQLAPGTTLEQIISRLKTVTGIGEWTAQYIAMRALRFPDAFPAGDLGLQKAAAGNVDRLSEKQLLARVEPFRPWRSYAALLLWHSLSLPGK